MSTQAPTAELVVAGRRPRLSVVVCVHDIEAWVADCLHSLLSQDHEDFEVLAVDDASSDSSPALLDEIAARDPRLRVVHLPHNVGLGLARNAGLSRCRGEYVLFLDGDDLLVPGSLAAVDERLAEASDPDVLLFDYARLYWWGELRRNRLGHLLGAAGSEPFRAADHPELLKILPIAWNKAYRRRFLEDLGLAFPPGYYEDLPWTYISLVSAAAVATLDRVCVHYRQRRSGSILVSESPRHVEVLDQYALIFEHLAAHPSLRQWQPVIFRQMLDHVITIWEHPRRLPPGLRPEFLRRASRACREHRPADGFPAAQSRNRTRKENLFLAGHLRTLVVLKALRKVYWRTRAGWRRARRQVRRRLRRRLLRLYYQAQLRLPLDRELAVYSAYWNRGYVCNPRAVFEAARELCPELRGVWVIARGGWPAPPGVPTVRPGSRAYWRVLARAGFVVNNVNFPDDVVKRRGSVHLQTQHGTPLKHMGVDLLQHPAAARGINFGGLLKRCDRWDFNLSANRYSSIVWRRAFPCSYQMLEYGQPRNDRLVRAGDEEVARLREELAPGGVTVVLYAPTHREYDRNFASPLDVGALAAALGPAHTILVRAHHTYRAVTGPDPTGAAATVLDVSRHPSIEELCLAADVLVTDYSSLMFDYANLGRPIVLFAPDWPTYRRVRGTYVDLLEEPPGAVATTQAELVEVFRSAAHRSPQAEARLAAFRERFCPHDDGHVAERVVRRVFLDGGGETDRPRRPSTEAATHPRRRPDHDDQTPTHDGVLRAPDHDRLELPRPAQQLSSPSDASHRR